MKVFYAEIEIPISDKVNEIDIRLVRHRQFVYIQLWPKEYYFPW